VHAAPPVTRKHPGQCGQEHPIGSAAAWPAHLPAKHRELDAAAADLACPSMDHCLQHSARIDRSGVEAALLFHQGALLARERATLLASVECCCQSRPDQRLRTWDRTRITAVRAFIDMPDELLS
jgi:hypothetical protein